MNKTKIIKEIVGQALEPYGYKYLKTDGPCRIFVKKLDGVKRYFDPEITTVELYINVQESNLFKGICVRLSADTYGNKSEKELEELKKLHPNGNMVWIPYTDEESYRKCLKDIAEMIIEYGIPMLDEMSVEDEVIPTKMMGQQLYEEHQALEAAFIEKYGLSATAKTENDIDEWFDKIREILISTCGQSYEETKELILMVSAFLGQRLCDIIGVEWQYNEIMQMAVVSNDYTRIATLSHIVDVWKKKCTDSSWKIMDFVKNMMKDAIR